MTGYQMLIILAALLTLLNSLPSPLVQLYVCREWASRHNPHTRLPDAGEEFTLCFWLLGMLGTFIRLILLAGADYLFAAQNMPFPICMYIGVHIAEAFFWIDQLWMLNTGNSLWHGNPIRPPPTPPVDPPPTVAPPLNWTPPGYVPVTPGPTPSRRTRKQIERDRKAQAQVNIKANTKKPHRSIVRD